MNKDMRKLTKNKTSFQVTIPQEWVKKNKGNTINTFLEVIDQKGDTITFKMRRLR